MAQTDVLSQPARASETDPVPELSIVVTLYDEAATLEDLYRRTVKTLDELHRRHLRDARAAARPRPARQGRPL